jgi:hypothetical protein
MDPDRWMREICAFIDLPFHPDVLISRHPQSDKRGVLGGIEPNTGRWRRYFPAQRLERLERIAGAYLVELGYPVEYVAGSQQLSAFRCRVWTVKDCIRQWSMMVGRKLCGQTRMSWSALLMLPVVAFKQARANRY